MAFEWGGMGVWQPGKKLHGSSILLNSHCERAYFELLWSSRSSIYYNGVTLTTAWICNHIQVQDEIIYPSPMSTVQFTGACDLLSMLGLKLINVSKGAPGSDITMYWSIEPQLHVLLLPILNKQLVYAWFWIMKAVYVVHLKMFTVCGLLNLLLVDICRFTHILLGYFTDIRAMTRFINQNNFQSKA